MVKCHICNKELLPARQKKSWLKDHECPHCYAKKALIYCKSCYWWEVGPLPALAALPKELKAPEESEVQLVTPCPLEEEKKAQEAETLKERREALLKSWFEIRTELVWFLIISGILIVAVIIAGATFMMAIKLRKL